MSDIRITPRLLGMLAIAAIGFAQATTTQAQATLNAWSGIASSPEMIGNVGHGFSMSQPIVHGLSVDLRLTLIEYHVSVKEPSPNPCNVRWAETK